MAFGGNNNTIFCTLLVVVVLWLGNNYVVVMGSDDHYFDDEIFFKRSRVVKCTRRDYPTCYMVRARCPLSCRTSCFMDCTICAPVCRCDRPGAVCQDPRFIGGDGMTFYFHGKKDTNFCLVSDDNLHINAHFVGVHNSKTNRDFTWVQSIAILFGPHRLLIGAKKTSKWDPNVDRLHLNFDGASYIPLPHSQSAKWQSSTFAPLSITRTTPVNTVVVEALGSFTITATVVPITKKDSYVHRYGIGNDDCMAHLDLAFKFHDLSDDVDGVLGQTYKKGYVSRAKVGVPVPVLGGEREFFTPNLFSPDCKASRFNGLAVVGRGGEEDKEESTGRRHGV